MWRKKFLSKIHTKLLLQQRVFEDDSYGFIGSKVEEDPNGFIEEVYKTVAIMGVCSIQKAELAAYQLKDFAQIWYEKWKDSRSEKVGPIEGKF